MTENDDQGHRAAMNIDLYVERSVRSSQTIADAIADALRRAILAGALPAGATLRQEALAAKFGVSRVPIREALLKLETDGLVVTHPRRGAVVTSIDASDLQEILEMRVSLESLALKLAIPRLQQADLDAASGVLDEADAGLLRRAAGGKHAATQEFEARWGELNWEFHRALYQAADRPRLMDTIENLHLQFARHLRVRLEMVAPALLPSAAQRVPPDTNEWQGVMREHREILGACQRKQVRTARTLLERHIMINGEELVRRLRAV